MGDSCISTCQHDAQGYCNEWEQSVLLVYPGILLMFFVRRLLILNKRLYFYIKRVSGHFGTFTYWECHLTVHFFCLCSSRTLDQLILKFQRLIVIVAFFGNGWHWSVMHIHIFLCSTVVTIVFSLFLWILLLGILLGIWLWLLGKTKFSNFTGHEVVKILPNYWSLSPMISF